LRLDTFAPLRLIFDPFSVDSSKHKEYFAMLKRFIKICLSFIILLVFIGIFSGNSTLSATHQEVLPYQVYIPYLINDPKPLAPAKWIGPGGGAITDLIFDPENPNIAFATTWGSGIFRSSDGGMTWENVSTGIENLVVTTIEISPNNSLTLYAGTYRGDFYKSVNGGKSWYPSSSGFQDGAIPYAIEIDPARPQRVYVATRGISNNGGPPWNGIVYRSDNGGQSWQPVLTDVGGSGQEDWAYDLSVNRWNTNIVYAATHEHGAYRSTDYGKSWRPINSGVSDYTGRAIEPDPRRGSEIVYLGVFRPTGIFKSKNRGDSWSIKTNNINRVRTYKIEINPNNKDTLYLSTFDHGVMRSTDGGESWASAGLSNERILDVVAQPGHYNSLLSGTIDNGVFRSTNNGESWYHSQSGLDASSVTSIILQPGNSQVLYASLFPGWLARSVDGGASWSDYHENINDKDIHALVIHPTKPNLLYALTDKAGLYLRDTQSGSGWQNIGNNLPSANLQTSTTPEHPFHRTDIFERLFPQESPSSSLNSPNYSSSPLLCLAFTSTDPAIGYLGTSGSGVYRSIDDGQNWVPVGLPGVSVYSMVVTPGEPNRIYAATNAAGSVQMSFDGGESWGDLNIGNLTAYTLAIPRNEPETLYAGTNAGVHRYTAGSWKPLGLAESTITSIAIHPTQTNIIVAGTTNGAYISIDSGITWGAGPSELQGISVQAVNFDINNPGLIYYATQTHGVLRAPIDDTK
jgi:photosystem II stability/assembly factor-like uncharacterized protein